MFGLKTYHRKRQFRAIGLAGLAYCNIGKQRILRYSHKPYHKMG
ncbi:hypothetical protein [Moraxella nonliquefaciens]|nr:hypothetical protein [Moraxella nonliquefaciens]